MDSHFEMASILSSPSVKRVEQFLQLTLNELALKLDDVALCSGSEGVSFGEFGKVFKGVALGTRRDVDPIESIFNFLLFEQNGDHQGDLLSISFILQYLTPIISKAIELLQLPRNWSDEIFDDILYEVVKLIHRQSGHEDMDNISEIGHGTTYSESTVNIFNIRDDLVRQHQLLHSAICNLMNISQHFPAETRFIGSDEESDSDLHLMKDLMSHSTVHCSPKILKVRVRKQRNMNRKRSYSLVDDENSSGSTHGDFEEIDIDESKLKHFYSKFTMKYKRDGLSQSLLDTAAHIASMPKHRRDKVLRAINVFDAATTQNAPVYMKADKIKRYLTSRGLTSKEIRYAHSCSMMAFERQLTLKLNSQSVSTRFKEDSVSDIHHYDGYTDNGYFGARSSLPLVKAPSRRDSSLEQNDIDYVNAQSTHNETQRDGNKNAAESKVNPETTKDGDHSHWYIRLAVMIALILILVICGMFAAAQLNSDGKRISFLYFGCFAGITLSMLSILIAVLTKRRPNLSGDCLGFSCFQHQTININVGATHWFIAVVSSQIILIVIESLRFLYLRPPVLYIYGALIGVYCLFLSPLYMMVSLSYHIAMNVKRSTLWREMGCKLLLILEVVMDLAMLMVPLLTLIDHDIGGDLYSSMMDVLRCRSSISFICLLFPMLLLTWHCLDIIGMVERKWNIILIPKSQAEDAQRSRFSVNADSVRRKTKSMRKPPPKEAVAASSPKVQSIYKCGSISEMNPDAFHEPTPSEFGARRAEHENAAIAWFNGNSGITPTPQWLDENVLLNLRFRKATDQNRREKKWALFAGVCIGIGLMLYAIGIILWILLRCL